MILAEKLPSVAHKSKYTDPQPDIVQRVRDFEPLFHKGSVPMKFMSLGVRELHKKEVDGGHQEKKALRVNRSQALMDSQRLKQHGPGLQGRPAPGLQSTHYGSSLMILWDC